MSGLDRQNQPGTASHELSLQTPPGWQQKIILGSGQGAQVSVSLCMHEAAGMLECERVVPANAYLACILLSEARICIHADAERLVDAAFEPGWCYMGRPGELLRISCLRRYKALHLHIPSQLLSMGADPAQPDALSHGRSLGPVKDARLLQLARALTSIADNRLDRSIGGQVVGMLVERLRSLRTVDVPAACACRHVTLPNWRLQRVDNYVKTHLAETVSLRDMANAAGLSPMHFAATFRATTGCRPHHYLLLCRLERAKQLMADRSRPILDIALEVGFRTQAHFTTVFKRMLGKTPGAWRQESMAARAFSADTAPGSLEG